MVKRVLHVVNKMGYGGIETLIMNIYRNIDKEKVQFDFAVASKEKGEYDDEIKKLGGRIFYIGKRRNGILKYKESWENFLKTYSPEFCAIHMHVSSLTDILPIKLAKKYNIQIRILHSHNEFQKGLIHNVLNFMHKFIIGKYATNLFACSQNARKYCFGNKKVEIIKNGIDAKKFEFNINKRNAMRRVLKLDENTEAFIHVGRFAEEKNHNFLIEIFAEIVKKRSNSKLFLIGSGSKEKEIRDKVSQLHLEDSIKFLGLRNDIPDVLQAMDCFIFPSFHEGLGIVTIEAQASGLKVFASDTIPNEVQITDLLQFVSLKKNANEWARIILDNIKYKRNSTYEKIVESGYDIGAVAKKLEKIYLS